MRYEAQRHSWFALVPVAAVLFVVAFVIGNPLGERSPRTSAPPVSASPAASPTNAAGQTGAPPPLSGKYAVVVASGQRLTFARENDGARVGEVSAQLGLFAISPEGTRIAYFVGPGFDELWIADVAHIDRAQRVLSIAPNFAGGLVWSTDGKGILFSSQSRERVPGPDGAPIRATLEGFDLDANRREPFSSQSNMSVRPLLWIREPRIVAAITALGQKGPGEYIAISAGSAKSWSLPDAARADVTVGWPVASSDGRWVASRYEYGARTLIRVWPTEDLSRATELEVPGIQIRSASWRPGSVDIAVDSGDALELWTREGGRRRVSDLGGRFVSAFRWDGSAAYAGSFSGQAELIEIDTGRRVPLAGVISTISTGPFGTGIVASARLE